MPEASTPVRLRFGVFEVDLRSGELRKQGVRLKLQEQPFQVLAMLLQRPGETVTRDDLRNRLWSSDTFVDFDHAVNKAVNRIRDALGDSATHPRFVETVARRGYRFIAEVAVIDEAGVAPVAPLIVASGQAAAEAAGPGPAASRGRSYIQRGGVIAGPMLALAGFAALIWSFVPGEPPSSSIHALAVLPLENLSGDAAQEYFADGMTDELITALGHIGALRVISRTSTMAYKRVRKPLPEIARELNVDAVVEGTVFRSGDDVRITAQLIDARDDKHLWSDSYSGDLRDTLALQNKVARAIAGQISISLNARERAALPPDALVNPQAHEAYLKGRYFWNKRTADDLQKAIGYFNDAIARDARYAPAYSGLADSYALLGDWEYGVLAPRDALPRARTAAAKALELDGMLAEAHVSLAFVLDAFDWDWNAADREFRRGIDLNPGYATAHHWYAWHLSVSGRNTEAIGELQAAQSLDPLSLIIRADLAELLLIDHRIEESVRQSRSVLDMDRNFPLAHNQLGLAYLARGASAQAVSELQLAVTLSGGSPICTANLARALAEAGHRDAARRLLADLHARTRPGYSGASEIAMIYAALGDADTAMKWLDTAYAERFNPSVLLRPGFDPLRSDSRFLDLERRVGLVH